MKKQLLVLAAGFLLIFVKSFQVWASKTTPTQCVHDMLEEIMAIQTDPSLQGDQFKTKRKEAIKGIIAKNFDFNAMARQALGSYWNNLSDSQRREFVRVFKDLFQDSYTRLVLNFLHREKINYLDEKLYKGKATVTTTIVRINDTIPVKYFMVLEGNRWLNQDVEVDGVSIVKNYQRAFARVIRNQSYEFLLERMRIQVKTLQ